MSPFDMEILAHINSPATKKNDERYIRQAEAFLNFETGRKTKYSLESKMKRRHEEHEEVVAKRQKFAEHPPPASTTTSIVKSNISDNSNSKSISESLRVDTVALKGSFSAFIGSPSQLLPQSPLKLLEIASNKWKILRTRQNNASEALAKVYKSEYLPTNSQLEETQAALDYIQDDVYGASQDTEEVESQVEETDKAEFPTLPQNLLDKGNDDAGNSKESKAFEISYMPSTLSTFDINTSKGSLKSKNEAQGNELEYKKDGSEHTDGDYAFNSEANIILESEVDSIHPSELLSELNSGPALEHEDPENRIIADSEEIQKSQRRVTPIATNKKAPSRVDSPHPSVKFLSVEGIPNSALTVSLQSLVSSSNIPYDPKIKVRCPGYWERGFWLIPAFSPTPTTPDWPLNEQKTFWARMVSRIQSGHAGIATWATRNVNDAGMELNEEEMSNDGHAAELGNVRVYCWGGIAKEIYSLCILESDGRLTRRGLKWLSALSGDTVVSMT